MRCIRCPVLHCDPDCLGRITGLFGVFFQQFLTVFQRKNKQRGTQCICRSAVRSDDRDRAPAVCRMIRCRVDDVVESCVAFRKVEAFVVAACDKAVCAGHPDHKETALTVRILNADIPRTAVRLGTERAVVSPGVDCRMFRSGFFQYPCGLFCCEPLGNTAGIERDTGINVALKNDEEVIA